MIDGIHAYCGNLVWQLLNEKFLEPWPPCSLNSALKRVSKRSGRVHHSWHFLLCVAGNWLSINCMQSYEWSPSINPQKNILTCFSITILFYIFNIFALTNAPFIIIAWLYLFLLCVCVCVKWILLLIYNVIYHSYVSCVVSESDEIRTAGIVFLSFSCMVNCGVTLCVVLLL